jgi:hypothetical protein
MGDFYPITLAAWRSMRLILKQFPPGLRPEWEAQKEKAVLFSRQECYTHDSVRAEPGVCSSSPNQARFCQWSLRFIQRNSIQETQSKWNKVL